MIIFEESLFVYFLRNRQNLVTTEEAIQGLKQGLGSFDCATILEYIHRVIGRFD